MHANTSVPFYLYDADVHGYDLGSVVAQMAANASCRAILDLHQYAAPEYWFLRRLVSHPWRVAQPADARVLVLPLLLSLEAHGYCEAAHLLDSTRVMRRIRATASWHTRQTEHVFVALDPAAVRTEPLRRVLRVRFDTQGGQPPITAGPLLEYPAKPFLYASAPARNVTFFFGGQVSRYHEGYYMRWELVDQLRAHPARFNNSVLLLTTDSCSGSAGLSPISQAPPGVTHGAYCGGRITAGKVYPRTEFALILGGDEPATRRETIALQFGAIPVYARDALWASALPFQHFIPYHAFSATVREEDAKRDLAGQLGAVAHQYGPATRAIMRLLMVYFRNDLMWKTNRSRAAENVLRDADRVFHRSCQPPGAPGPLGTTFLMR